MTTKPPPRATPLLTTVVGSYPAPSWLAQARTREALRDATLAVLKIQENAGIDVIADGELSRFNVNHPETNGMVDYFLAPLEGIDVHPTREELAEFQRHDAAAYRREPAAVVRGLLGEGRLNLHRDWRFVEGLTRHPLKFTCTGPHMLARVLMDKHYHDLPRLAMDLALILRKQLEPIEAAVLQIDEASIAGHPEDGPWAAQAINQVLGAARGERAVHVCFGNYGGQTVQRGHWSKLLDFLNALEADHLVLECARRPAAEVAALGGLRPSLGLGIGVVDVKENQIETADQVASRIEEAARLLGGAHRLRYVHPDCGLWMLHRSVADGKLAALVRGRDLFLGK